MIDSHPSYHTKSLHKSKRMWQIFVHFWNPSTQQWALNLATRDGKNNKRERKGTVCKITIFMLHWTVSYAQSTEKGRECRSGWMSANAQPHYKTLTASFICKTGRRLQKNGMPGSERARVEEWGDLCHSVVFHIWVWFVQLQVHKCGNQKTKQNKKKVRHTLLHVQAPS